MYWYMAEYDGERDNDYELFDSDEEAIAGFTGADDEGNLIEIWRCDDDECLTPLAIIWH